MATTYAVAPQHQWAVTLETHDTRAVPILDQVAAHHPLPLQVPQSTTNSCAQVKQYPASVNQPLSFPPFPRPAVAVAPPTSTGLRYTTTGPDLPRSERQPHRALAEKWEIAYITGHREAFNREIQDSKEKRQKRREDIAAMRQVIRRLQPIAAP